MILALTSVSKHSKIVELEAITVKLVSHRHHYDLRKYSFAARIANTCNSLPQLVIAAETTNCFKNRLDKLWNDQEIKFDYKAKFTEIGNRSNII